MAEPTKKELLAEERRRRLRFVVTMLPGVLSVLLLIYMYFAPFEILPQFKFSFSIGLILGGASLFALLMNYLRFGSPWPFPKEAKHFAPEIVEIERLRSELKQVRDNQSRALASIELLTHEQRKEFVQALRDELESEAVNGVF